MLPVYTWHSLAISRRKMGDASDPVALFCSAAESGDAEQLKLLAAAGTDVNCTRPDGSSALLLAALKGHTAACSELISLGADVHHTKSNGATAIFAAAAADAVECVRELHAAGAVLDTPNAHGVTPLQMAAHKNNAESLRLLLCLGAEPSAADNAGNTAAHKAARSNAIDALEGLLTHGDGGEGGEGNYGHHSAELQRQLLMTNSTGQTPLELALQAGAQDCVNRLLRAERAVSTAIATRKTELEARIGTVEAELTSCGEREAELRSTHASAMTASEAREAELREQLGAEKEANARAAALSARQVHPALVRPAYDSQQWIPAQ